MEKIDESWEVQTNEKEELLKMQLELKIYEEIFQLFQSNWYEWFLETFNYTDKNWFSEDFINEILFELLKNKTTEYKTLEKIIKNRFKESFEKDLAKWYLSIIVLISIIRNNKNTIFLWENLQGKFYKYDKYIESKFFQIWFDFKIDIEKDLPYVDKFSLYDDKTKILILWWKNDEIIEVGSIPKDRLYSNKHIITQINSYLFDFFKTTKEL